MSVYLICLYIFMVILISCSILTVAILIQNRNKKEKKIIMNLKQKNSTIYIKYDLKTKEIVINSKYSCLDLDATKFIAELSKKEDFNEEIKKITKDDDVYECEEVIEGKLLFFKFSFREKVENYTILRCDYTVEKIVESIDLPTVEDLKEFHNTCENKKASLYHLNIKEFNNINQRYGQRCGDTVLEIIKNRIAKLEKNNLKCCYLGSDQFAIYYNNKNINKKKAMKIIKDINRKLIKPIDVGCLNFDLVYGVGVCVGEYEDLDQFIKCAYVASDYARKRKKYNIIMYNESMKLENDMTNFCEQELNSILNNKDININYNPVFNHSKNKFVGYIGSPVFSNLSIKYDSLKTYSKRVEKKEDFMSVVIDNQLINYLKKRPKKTSKLFLNLNLEDLPVFLETYLSNPSYSDCKIVICLNVKRGYEMLNKHSHISSAISKIIEEGIDFALEINYSNMYNYDYILKNASYLILDESIVNNMSNTLVKNKFLNIIELAKTYELELFAIEVTEYIQFESLLKQGVNYFSGPYFGKGARKPNEIEQSKTKIFAKFIKDSKKNKKN